MDADDTTEEWVDVAVEIGGSPDGLFVGFSRTGGDQERVACSQLQMSKASAKSLATALNSVSSNADGDSVTLVISATLGSPAD